MTGWSAGGKLPENKQPDSRADRKAAPELVSGGKRPEDKQPDMAEGCKEKFDLQFVRWILLGGRSAEKRRRYRNILEKYPEKTVVIKNQRELDRFYLNFLLAQSAGIHRPAAEP